eukprot:3678813-Rhodomonas_salina.2
MRQHTKKGGAQAVSTFTPLVNASHEVGGGGLLLVELHNLCRAHKGEIQRIEEYHDPFALELLRAEVHETIAQNRRAAPVWSWLADRKCLGAAHSQPCHVNCMQNTRKSCSEGVRPGAT